MTPTIHRLVIACIRTDPKKKKNHNNIVNKVKTIDDSRIEMYLECTCDGVCWRRCGWRAMKAAAAGRRRPDRWNCADRCRPDSTPTTKERDNSTDYPCPNSSRPKTIQPSRPNQNSTPNDDVVAAAAAVDDVAVVIAIRTWMMTIRARSVAPLV